MQILNSSMVSCLPEEGRILSSFLADNVNIEGVEPVRQLIFQHISNHFKKSSQVRLDIGGLVFKSLSEMKGTDLIKPFLLEEIKVAVWECYSFKCPGPNGINLGFFKDFWEILKVDLLIFFCGILS